ncbi:MAG: tRNA cyclic N6-threonylcarbamoyladenosine(37) synthase TcdA [Oleiphilaceae bacterium]|nr:tRNA cyclic N6-threonylcarbamoyladenosine(37) synthase TcdA [Oleiphilaceae bacterium]
MQDDYNFRFGGVARLYGQAAAEYFSKAHIAVIGIGGVGSWAAEALARSGIGKITLFDLDDICVSNINRQIHATQSTIGQLKVEIMAQRLRQISPGIEVDEQHCFVTPSNVAQVLSNEYDYVFDATDSVKAKTAIIAHCRRHKIPIITSGGAGGQTDPTQIHIADLSRTTQDPLLAKIRNNLRRLHGFSRNPKRKFSVDAVYSTENLVYDQGDGTVCQSRPEQGGPARLDCASGFGAVTHVTACFGMVAVSHILKKLAMRAVQ